MAHAEVDEDQAIRGVSDVDIPPAIACAVCGKGTCEGCTEEDLISTTTSRLLPWEQREDPLLKRLVDTCELTAERPDLAFGQLTEGGTWTAFGFALFCEVLAVGSFSVAWGLAFYAGFPRIALHMATSPAVLLLASSILLALLLFVVFVHALWGVGLEWGIARCGRPVSLNLGLRFGLYACGWDLLTSPFGFLVELRRGGLSRGFALLRAGARAPRPSVKAYLEDCRKLTPKQQKKTVWTAVFLGLFAVLLCGGILFISLLALWLPGLFS